MERERLVKEARHCAGALVDCGGVGALSRPDALELTLGDAVTQIVQRDNMALIYWLRAHIRIIYDMGSSYLCCVPYIQPSDVSKRILIHSVGIENQSITSD